MISETHSILLIDRPPSWRGICEGQEFPRRLGIEASGSCLRYGLGVKLHTDTASSHAGSLCAGKICCLFTVLLLPFACYLFYFFLGSRPPAIHVQLRLHRPASCRAC